MTVPPLVLDIDGTLTDGHGRIDSRVFEIVPQWEAPIVLATGKAFPYPVALCHFLGIEERVVAENGGVAYAEDTIQFTGDRDRVDRAVEAFLDRGGDLGWGPEDTVNRWRETEVAIHLEADESLLRTVAAEFDLEVIDSGYAYHLKSPDFEKGDGLRAIADVCGYDLSSFVAIGDSENDVSTFEVVGESYAVANADERARSAADTVLEESYFDGTLSVLDKLSEL